MNYLILGVVCFVLGVAAGRIYWSKAISLGSELLKRADGVYANALKHVQAFPAKVLGQIKRAI